MPVCVYRFLWYFSACVSGSFSGMVSDSVSGSPAMLLMVSLPVLLTLSLCLPASGRVFHRVSCGSFGCVLAVLWPCLWLVIWFIYLFLWLCLIVPGTVSPVCVWALSLGLCLLFWAVSLASVFAVCLHVPGSVLSGMDTS